MKMEKKIKTIPAVAVRRTRESQPYTGKRLRSPIKALGDGLHLQKAFTLIELLVVVLIIGILAAIAVPQYEKSVIKSRVATILPVLKTIKDAEEVYYMQNGNYTLDPTALGVQLPATCTEVTGGDGGVYKCGDFFLLDLDASEVGAKSNNGKITANYCPHANNSWNSCAEARVFQVRSYYLRNTSSEWTNNFICSPFKVEGTKICKLLGKPFSGCSGCTEL